MAITTMTGLRAGMQPRVHYTKANAVALGVGNWWSYWAKGGLPIAGAFDNTLNGVVLSSTSAQVTGQITFLDPPSGNAYLARFEIQGANNVSGIAMNGVLCDRLWHNGNIDATSTGAQAITSPTWPARDEAGATNGLGVFLAVEIEATMGAATPNISVSYTNTAGTAGRTGTGLRQGASASAVGTFYHIGLQAGDVGVKSVESITLDASWLSGTMHLIAYRPLAMLGAPNPAIMSAGDAITLGMPRLYNGTVPFIIGMSASSTQVALTGLVQFAQG